MQMVINVGFFLNKSTFISLITGLCEIRQQEVDWPSLRSLSLISHAKIVGLPLLYSSIFITTVGVATFGLLPPIVLLLFPITESMYGAERIEIKIT